MSAPSSDASPSPEIDDALAVEAEIRRLARARRRGRGLRVAARRALALARRYRDEEGAGGEREVTCVAQALEWRRAAAELGRNVSVSSVGPGLARATPAVPSSGRRSA